MKKREVALAAAQALADGLREPYAVLLNDRNRWVAEAVSFLATPMGSTRYGDRPRAIVQPAAQSAPVRAR